MKAKLVVSVSLRPSSQDKEVELEVQGHPVRLLRRGCDGQISRALELCRFYDDKADAIGIGGTNIYLDVAGRKYPLRDGTLLAQAIKHSKVGDGNRVKKLLERSAVQALIKAGIPLRGRPALITSAVDRWSLAESLREAGCELTYADLMVGLDLPIALRSPRTVRWLARVMLPVIMRLPTRFFYPSGESTQGEPSPALARHLERAEFIGGDFLQIHANLPERLDGKVILTNTTTAEDVVQLRERGLRALVTSTPRLDGRSFGTNVMEALALAFIDKPGAQVTETDVARVMKELSIEPSLEIFA